MQKTNTTKLPSLNALKAFDAAARHLSFTHAAQELNVTQGAVSRQIKLLEDQLNVILFHRQHKKLKLSDQGRVLVSPLANGFKLITDAVVKLKDQQQDFSLKVHPTFAIRWLIPKLHLFQTLHPDIQIRLTTSSQNVNFQRENFDAGITHLGKETPDIIRNKILTEKLIPVCSPQLFARGRKIKKPEDLKYHTLLHNNPDQKEWHDWAVQVGLDDLPTERGQIFEVDDAALQAATAGLGVALGDLFLIRDELSAGRLIAPLGITPMKTGSYYFVRPRSTVNTDNIDAFGKWLIKTIDQY